MFVFILNPDYLAFIHSYSGGTLSRLFFYCRFIIEAIGYYLLYSCNFISNEVLFYTIAPRDSICVEKVQHKRLPLSLLSYVFFCPVVNWEGVNGLKLCSQIQHCTNSEI